MNILVDPQITAALIALIGVLVSVFLSVLTSQQQLKAEIQNLEKTIQAKYEEKLVDARLPVYQILWETLSLLSKNTLQAKLNEQEIAVHILDVYKKLENWYEASGILFSKNAYGRFTRLCASLDDYAKESNRHNPAYLAEIRKRVWDLRQVMREDMHLTPIAPRSINDND